MDNIQQQIDRLRTIIIQGSDHDVEQDMEKPKQDLQEQKSLEIQQEDIKPSREVQFRDRIASLLRLAGSSGSEEDSLDGLRKIIHTDTSSSDVSLGLCNVLISLDSNINIHSICWMQMISIHLP